MTKLLYIGNKLAAHGKNLTSIETLGPMLEREGYKIWYASSRRNKLWRMLDMIVKTLLYGRRCDYVLIDTYSTWNFWYAVIISQLCRVMNVRYIAKLHGGDLPARLRNNPKVCNMLFGHSYLNVAPSGYLMDAFEKAGFHNLAYVPNTIEFRNYPFKQRKGLRPKLLWVRSFSPIYNPKMAVLVTAGLQKIYPDAELCMVGPDPTGTLPKVQQLALSMGVNAKFTGRLSKEDWIKLSQQYDIFINTTHFDNTPVSVIEAMALGLPIVSTNVGGIPFLLENRQTGLLVNDSDVSAMISAVIELVSNDALASQISKNALELVRGFDSEKVKWKWFEILK